MGADGAPADPDLGPHGDLLAHVLAAAGDGGDALVVGQAHEDRSMSSSIVAVSSDSDSALGSSGLKAGSLESEASALCSCGGDGAEAAELGAGRLPDRWRSGPAPAPSRRRRRRRSAGRRRAWRRSDWPSYSYQPCSGAMLANSPAGEEPQHLELGIDARLQPPEDLQHRLVAEHDRRVGLLDAHRAHRRVQRQRAAQLHAAGSGSSRPRPRPSARRRSGAAARARAPGRRRRRPRSSSSVAQTTGAVAHLVGGEQRERQLVELVAAGGKPRLDEREQQRRRVGDRHALLDLQTGDVAGLGRVPALALQPRRHLVRIQALDLALVRGCCTFGHPIASSPSWTSWNQ